MPSVSASTGDWFPERNWYQYFMAAASGPRFAIVFLSYYLLRAEPAAPKGLNNVMFFFGLARVVRSLSTPVLTSVLTQRHVHTVSSWIMDLRDIRGPPHLPYRGHDPVPACVAHLPHRLRSCVVPG